jgi:phosphoribosylformylglycinamidine synthase
MWQFAKCCEGIKDACEELNTPVISGNVSLYNETNGKSVYPTPAIAMVGVNDDQNKILTSNLKGEGNTLYLLGDTASDFGGSLYLKELFNETSGVLGKIDYKKELALWDIVIKANEQNLLESSKDLSSGGLALALAKMVAISDFGVNVKIDLGESENIFSESFSRAVVEVKPENKASFEDMINDLSYIQIGTVTLNKFVCNDVSMESEALREVFFNTFEQEINKDI